MKFKYYIQKNVYSSNKQGLKIGVRIEKIPSIYTIDFENGDGPFDDLLSLKKKSTIYRNLLLTNPKRAQQICLEKNISVAKNFIFTKEDFSVSKDFIDLFEHCIKGKIKNGKVYGVHYYDSEKVKILNIIEENRSNGVWKAEIEYYNIATKKWVKKDRPSTFFPLNWTMHQLFYECYYAVNNKKLRNSSDNVYLSKTETGINVEIICVNGKTKSIYPLL